MSKVETAKGGGSAETRKVVYNDTVVRWFTLASVIFGVVGLLVGVIIALQLAWWPANLAPYLTFGRLRPLHTNAVIFAFVGNMMFAGVYYSTQRLLKTRMASDVLSKVHFFGWQLIIVAAAVSLPLGISTGKEYAELEWPVDIAIALIWVVFAINFFWTLAIRNEKHLYVAIWFYIATIITIAVLHIVNSLELPVTALKSYSIYGGAKDALVQWWYGHNAVAFFLTTPILGIMYYFVPKASGRPVFSYRLSVIHFWALVFMYIWAGPHHLLNTALPDWAQSLGMLFSVMLWAPSWGGMINGLFTLRGAWDKVRVDPVLKFFAAAVTFYGMATFEGPLLSIKSVNALAHYTDWIIGHVHSGALGWNGFMAFGFFYWAVPRLWGTKLHSTKMADAHFWLGTIGILIYMVSMWISGVTQGLMWKEVATDGSLVYNFVQTVEKIQLMYVARLVGGLMYFVGFLLGVYNLFKTVASGSPVEDSVTVVVPKKVDDGVSTGSLIFGKPVLVFVATVALMCGIGLAKGWVSVGVAIATAVVAIGGAMAVAAAREKEGATWHRLMEGRALLFSVFVLLAALIGGAIQIIPTLLVKPVAMGSGGPRPYTALELEGRDVYLREGCYVCHSQMIRPFRAEVARYGDVSTLEDSQWDHPFQWGSKRTGPDLAREGNGPMKKPNAWHYGHMIDPRKLTIGSIMPAYPHLANWTVDFTKTSAKLNAMESLGVPYTKQDIAQAGTKAREQAQEIVADLKKNGVSDAKEDSELVALVAYLQSLGRAPIGTAPVSMGGR